MAILSLPLSALLWHGASQGYYRESKDLEEDIRRLSEFVGGNVAQVLDSTRQLLIAVTTIYHLSDPATHVKHFEELAAGWPFVRRFGVATPVGEILCAVSPGMHGDPELPDAELLQRAMLSREIVIGALRSDAADGRSILNVAYRMAPGASATATAIGFAQLDFGWLDYLLSEEKVIGRGALTPEGTVVSIVNRSGTVMGRYPDPGHWVGRSIADTPFFSRLAAHPEGYADIVSYDGVLRFYAFCRVQDASNDLIATVGLSRRSALAAARNARRNAMLGLALIVLALCGVAWYGVDAFVVRPVARLTATAGQLRNGDWLARARLTTAPREILSLSRAFDDMADDLRAYEQRLRATTLDLSLAEERERRRIAHALHEGVGPVLAACYMKLGRLKKCMSDATGMPTVAEVRDLLDRAIGQTQSLTFTLSSPTLHTIGLSAALEQLCGEIGDEHGLDVAFSAQGDCGYLSEDRRVVLFQAGRELLRNVVKHAHARTVALRLDSKDGQVRITVRDDGIGFDAASSGRAFGKSGGFGLFNLAERFRHLDGRFSIRSAPGMGTEAVVGLKTPGRNPAATEEVS